MLFKRWHFLPIECKRNFKKLIKMANKTLLDEAMDKVTIEILNGLDHGEEIELNEKYTLYHYTEEDIIVLNETEEWEEIFQIMTDGEKIIFEKL